MLDKNLQAKFDAAKERHEKSFATSNADYFLSSLQSAVKELHERGMNISMETAPRAKDKKSDDPVMATAMVVAEDVRTEWRAVIARNESYAMLAAYSGNDQIANFYTQREYDSRDYRKVIWSKPELINASDLKEAIMNVITDAVALSEVAGKYDVKPEAQPLQKKALKSSLTVTP